MTEATPRRNEEVFKDMVEIYLTNPENFLKVKETLTRIGVSSFKKKTLYQSCHILHKQGKYYIVHFKTLFKLDGKPCNYSDDDLARTNTVAKLLQDWGLVTVAEHDAPKLVDNLAPLSKLKILSYKDKEGWTLVPKYTIGVKT